MLRVITDFDYKTIDKMLHDLFPSIKMTHIASDRALVEMGFADYPPCIFTMDITWDEYEEMMLDLMQIEVDAFNTPDGEMPEKDDLAYLRYLEYGWLWDMFYNAEVTKVSKTNPVFSSIFEVVKTYIDQWDPYNLLSECGCPDDEFDIESQMIADLINTDSSLEEVNNAVSLVFSKMFEPQAFQLAQCKDVSENIYKALLDMKDQEIKEDQAF